MDAVLKVYLRFARPFLAESCLFWPSILSKEMIIIVQGLQAFLCLQVHHSGSDEDLRALIPP